MSITAYVDISEYLDQPQVEVAKLFNMPTSTFQNKWKRLNPNRKWPSRYIKSLNNRIMSLRAQKIILGDTTDDHNKVLDALIVEREILMKPMIMDISYVPARPCGKRVNKADARRYVICNPSDPQ